MRLLPIISCLALAATEALATTTTTTTTDEHFYFPNTQLSRYHSFLNTVHGCIDGASCRALYNSLGSSDPFPKADFTIISTSFLEKNFLGPKGEPLFTVSKGRFKTIGGRGHTLSVLANALSEFKKFLAAHKEYTVKGSNIPMGRSHPKMVKRSVMNRPRMVHEAVQESKRAVMKELEELD